MDRVCVLVVGAGARWEPVALEALRERPGIVLLRRCMDVTDLLAHVATGQAQVAVLAAEAPGLDADAVAHLARHGVQPVAVLPAGGDVERLHRTGVRAVLGEADLAQLPDAVLALGRTATRSAEVLPEHDEPAAVPGRVIAVWGPAGAPGRTTVALGLAGELVRRGGDPLVLDLDPWGGTVAQHLGVLDEVSGLLAAARAAGSGDLETRFPALQRRVAGMRVLTGLPRAERWVEVRTEAVERLLEVAAAGGDVVVDTGFSLEDDAGSELVGRPGRNALTLAALEAADELVVVGTADPVGLSRLARGLAELNEVTGGRPVHVAVNRWRARLGISGPDVSGLLTGYGTIAGLHLLPEDGPAVDRALVAGRTLAETGDGPLAKALGGLLDASHPSRRAAPGSRGGTGAGRTRVRGVRGRRGARALRP